MSAVINKPEFRPEIGGLRCLAVLAVLVFHLDPNWAKGGYLGVDVFFVISGFLISSIIYSAQCENRFSLRQFYSARFHRIFPLAITVLLLTSLAHHLLFYRPDLYLFSFQKLAALWTFANAYFLSGGQGYWTGLTADSPYLHYWSLSIEIHFYLLFGLLMWLLRGVAFKWVFACLAVITASSLALYLFAHDNYPDHAYFLMPTRIWQLGVGGLLGLYSVKYRLALPRSAVFTAFALLILVGLLITADKSSWPALDAIVAVVATAFIIAGGSNVISKPMLQNPVALYIGKISYSLYLWHWPVIVSARLLEQYGYASLDLVSIVLISLCLSVFSYHTVESPFQYKRLTWRAAVVTMSLITLLLLTERHFILQKSYSQDRFATPTWHGLYYDIKPGIPNSDTLKAMTVGVHVPERPYNSNEFLGGGLIRRYAEEDPRVVLIGDSHAVMWANTIDRLTQELSISTSFMAMNGVNPFKPYTSEARDRVDKLNQAQADAFDKKRAYWLEQWQPDLVLLSARWELVDLEDTRKLLDSVTALAKRIVLIESPPPLLNLGNRNAANFASYIGVECESDNACYWHEFDQAAMLRSRQLLGQLSDYYENVEVLEVADLFLDDGKVLFANGHDVFYLDDDHVTTEGANLATSRLRAQVRALAAPKGIAALTQ